ncbi:MAG: hypothetical protein QOI61_803 [Actinomycetota bacterium]|jgi:non-specific serine/threonine protein kinase
MHIRERYELLEALGQGAQGSVVRAVDHVHDREVAIKIRHAADPTALAAVLREGRVLFDVPPHPGLTLLREDFIEGDNYYLVMDLVRGERLSDLMAREGSPGLPFDRVLAIARDLADALDHLHACAPPLVHGDVKPANVLLDGNGRTRLVDFGLTSASGNARGGTAQYMAPEAALGTALTPAADVYSLAVLIHHLLFGSAPEPGGTPGWEALPAHLREQVANALDAGLQIDPARRPARASDLVARLLPAATPTNLPAAISSLIGREDELTQLRGALRGTRLLTLTGTGGIGKTRLAIELARSELWRFSGGVHLVDLGAIVDRVALVESMAQAIEAPPSPAADRLEAVLPLLASGSRMLVLDTCEHILDVVADFAWTVLSRAPELTIIATSRTPLRVEGERIYRVPSLPVPEPDMTTAQARVVPSIRLIVERAESSTGAAPADEDLPSIFEIAARLDGIPLALELAAGAMRVLSPVQILRSLGEQFSDLSTGSRRLARHETLRATIEWSLRLLTEPELTLLRRLSVFAGNYSLDAACRVAAWPPVEEQQVPILLGQLHDASLVEPAGLPNRFRLLDTVRTQSREALDRVGEANEMVQRHAAWLEATVEDSLLAGAFGAVDDEIDEIRLAMARLTERDPTRAGYLLARLSTYISTRTRWSELLEWADRLLALDLGIVSELQVRTAAIGAASQSGQLDRGAKFVDGGRHLIPSGDEITDARFLSAQAQLFLFKGSLNEAGDAARRAAALLRRAGSERSLLSTLVMLAAIEASLGKLLAAKDVLEEAIPIAEEHGPVHALIAALSNLASVDVELGALADAEVNYLRARELGIDTDDKRSLGVILGNLATIRDERGDVAGARDAFAESLALRVEMRDERGRAHALVDLGGAEERLGNLDRAGSAYEESLEISRALDDPVGVALALASLAGLRRIERDLVGAERLAHEALTSAADTAHVAAITICLDQWALTLDATRERGLALRAVAAADELRRSAGAVRPSSLAHDLESLAATATATEAPKDVIAALLARH